MTTNDQQPPIDELLEAAIEADAKANREGGEGNEWLLKWYPKKMVQIEAERLALEEQTAKQLKRINAEENHIKYKYLFPFQVEAKRCLAQETMRKSVHLPYGTIGYRTKKENLEVQDRRLVLQWAVRSFTDKVFATLVGKLDMSLAIEGLLAAQGKERVAFITLDVKKTPLTDHLKRTGELPDGCELQPPEEVFYLKPAKGEGKNDD